MEVTAEQTFVSALGTRRGRICRRSDGLFQVVTETLRPDTHEELAHWWNDHPPSGLFERQKDAERYLQSLLPDCREVHGLKPTTFNLEVGPYPEPVTKGEA
jgi:hypothetical protein